MNLLIKVKWIFKDIGKSFLSFFVLKKIDFVLFFLLFSRSIENQNIILKTNGITGTSTNWSPKMTAPSLIIDSKLKTNPPATISILMGKVFLNSALWTMNELKFVFF